MNPYETQPTRAFWKPSVADRPMLDIRDLWTPKFPVTPDMPVATYGSCFAQHIGRALVGRSYNWLQTETPPARLRRKHARIFNYNVFSSRTANIYTTSMLRQWCEWAIGGDPVPGEIWHQDERFFDPFRPLIEPDGFESTAELLMSRAKAVSCFRDSITQADVLIFTLGLTERWINSRDGHEYAMCPGTAAGEFSTQQHEFDNLDFLAVRDNLIRALELMRNANPDLKVILTVSPVPLTATASGQHVLVSTMYSKSVLRAVAGELAESRPFVDYFPAYEMITSPVFRGEFFAANLRDVTDTGVGFVMDSFFTSQGQPSGPPPKPDKKIAPDETDDLVCEEEILAAFGDKK